MISINCVCGETFHAEAQHVGRRVQCRCGRVIEIVVPAAPQLTSSSDFRSERASRRWVFYVGAAVLVLLSVVFWFGRNGGDESSNRKLNPPVHSPIEAVPQTESAPPLSALSRCPVDLPARPKSGAELGGRHRGGLGKLRVENGTDSDAVAVLIDEETTTPRRAIFIRSGESGVVTSVPPGRYHFRFQLGTDWLRERRFCRLIGTSEFDEVFDFEEEFTSEQRTKYRTFEVTLHPVLQGTARTHAIDASVFELPPP